MQDTCSSHFEPKLLKLKRSLKEASASEKLCYFCEFSVSMGFMEFDGLNRLQWVPIDNVWVHFSQKTFSPSERPVFPASPDTSLNSLRIQIFIWFFISNLPEHWR